MIYSRGAYLSGDIDIVLSGRIQLDSLDRAMAELGFRRRGDRYIHPRTEFFVEFPSGPLAIGRDHEIHPIILKSGKQRVLSLSSTDSCRDRLSAFFHWQDLQSFETAVSIALKNRIHWNLVHDWSVGEGHLEEFEEFEREVARRRRSRRLRKAR